MGPIQSISDLFGMIRRRFWIMAAVFFLGAVATIVHALSMERIYETTAVIEFDTPLLNADDGGAAQPTVARQQLQIIEQRLMARESLTEIIDRYDLFADLPDLSATERVAALREATRFHQVAAVQSGGFGSEGRLSAMLITVRLGDAELVAALANEFAQRVVEDSFRSVSERTTEAVSLFREQEERLAAETRALEAEISRYKLLHQESLPEGQQFRRDEFQRLQENLLTIDRTLQELERERRVFETFGTRSVLGAGGLPVTTANPAASIEAELRIVETELARARQVLAPTNPEIQRLELQIEALNAQAEEVRAEARERFLVDIDSQIDLLRSQRGIISERLDSLRTAMTDAPVVEIELAAMDMELTRLQERYAVAANQLAAAENAQMFLEAQQSDSMRLLEPAIVPEYPVGPSRTRTAMLGVGMAGLAALVAGFLLELRRPALRTAQAVASRTGLKPVVTIPPIRTPAERWRGIGRELVHAALFVLFCGGVLYAASQISAPFAAILSELGESTGVLSARGGGTS